MSGQINKPSLTVNPNPKSYEGTTPNLPLSGSASPAGGGGKICYEDVVHLLTCPCCGAAVSAPVSQVTRYIYNMYRMSILVSI